MIDEFPEWTGNERFDGVKIEQNRAGFWLISKPGGVDTRLCPCCRKPMATDRAAKIVAERLYPAPTKQ